MKKIVTAALVAASLAMFGCATSAQNEPDYADDEAMEIIANGWIDRAEALEGSDEKVGAEYDKLLKDAVQAEIDADAQLKERQFEDTRMQEDVLAYLNSLDAQMDVLNNYSSSSIEYYEKWTEAYDDRTAVIKTLADRYGLAVEGKYKTDFDRVILDGTNAIENDSKEKAIEDLVSGAVWEAVDDGYGNITYTAIVENTSEYDFENVSIVLGLYGEDDVRTESYAHATSWKSGDKVKFEAFSLEGLAVRVEASVDYFEAD